MSNSFPIEMIEVVDPEHRIVELERKLDVVIWLHAELVYSWRLALATQYAEQMQPQVRQAIIDQIMSG